MKLLTKIQARWKGKQDRNKVQKIKEEKEKAATKIQANWKGKKTSQKIQK